MQFLWESISIAYSFALRNVWSAELIREFVCLPFVMASAGHQMLQTLQENESTQRVLALNFDFPFEQRGSPSGGCVQKA